MIRSGDRVRCVHRTGKVRWVAENTKMPDGRIVDRALVLFDAHDDNDPYEQYVDAEKLVLL